jgi:phosphohistidine phosphatase
VRTLYLLRHAKSSWTDPSLGDYERPLAPRGRRDAKRLSKHLRRLEAGPDLVLCSSAARTQETLDLLGSALEDSTVLLEEELYGASRDDLLARVRLVPDAVTSVMVIGHNPGLHELALELVSTGDELTRLERKFPTCALATLTIAGSWERMAPGDAVLATFLVPKDLS